MMRISKFKEETTMSVKLYTITHKKFTPPPDPMYIPLQVGKAISADLGYLGDNSGVHISEKNPFFCELTGMYWLWKNDPNTDYIGICHYRRYLINAKGELFQKAELEQLFSQYDIITTKMLTLPCTYYDGFGQNHYQKDLILTGDILREKYPEYHDTYERMVHDTHTYFGNILITSKPVYDRYCTWLFDILFELEKRVDVSSYDDYNKRLFGFISEFLQTVWIEVNHLNVCECMVGMTGEKFETRQLRSELAKYFARGDYCGAQNCFMACYQKRPDILMEASDITGELRLCMQIISTCNFEYSESGHCILERMRDYDSLIHYFSQLNRKVRHFINHTTDESDRAYLMDTGISPASIRIALKLFCDSDEQAECLFQTIYSNAIHD